MFSEVLRVPPRNIDLIRNGSEPLPIGQNDEIPAFVGEPLVLSVGRLERYKGHHKVIAAMPFVLEVKRNAKLIVVGSGPYEYELRSLVSDLGLSESVYFTSYSSDERSAMAALVNSSDVVALLSEYEAHPIAVMEALAAERPVVVADTSGLSELGAHPLVNLINLNSGPDEVASSLLSAVTEMASYSPIRPLQSWDECTDQLIEMYLRVARPASLKHSR
jgi:glycosyltransferase involved in cell wall biosynthesis